MNPRDNFFAMMEGGSPERLPFDIAMTRTMGDELAKRRATRDEAEALGSDTRQIFPSLGEDPERWREAYAALGVDLPERHTIARCGITMRRPEREMENHFSLVHTLADVEEVSELEALPWPDPADPAHYRDAENAVEAIKQRGLVSVLNMTCTIFEDSWYLRGLENVLVDLAEEGEVTLWLLDFMTRRSAAVAKAYARAGVDVIWLGDDIGSQKSMMMAPDLWRRHFKPRLAEVIRAARTGMTDRQYIMYHTDGSVEPVIGDLFEIGVDILNPVQPECMDVRGILTEHRHRGAFWGMVGTQTTMPHGSPDDVREAVGLCLELARQGTRLVCAPTHVIESDVPWENIDALVDAVAKARLGQA